MSLRRLSLSPLGLCELAILQKTDTKWARARAEKCAASIRLGSENGDNLLLLRKNQLVANDHAHALDHLRDGIATRQTAEEKREAIGAGNSGE